MARHSYNVQELVSKIERGEIKLPEMQRSYVWPATRVRDLLDSLYRNYPSGTILTWESEDDVPTRDFAVTQGQASTSSFQLLLDGQQRLTSLSAVIRGQPVYVKNRKKPIDLLFNLEHPDELTLVTEVNEKNKGDDEYPDEDDATEEDVLKRTEQMAFALPTPRLVNQPHWILVSEALNGSDDAELLKKCGVENLDDPRFSKYTKRLKRLRDIKDYTYDVHVLERSKSYEEVTEIFVRVNSLGAKLRGSDLALAQITAKWSNSLSIFEKFQSECKEKGFQYDLGVYIKSLVSFATGQSRFKIVSRLSQESLNQGWEDSKRGFDYALNFVRSNMGIDSPVLLSTPFLIVTLGYYAYKNDFSLTPDEENALRYWLLVANAKGRYSRGSSDTLLDQDLRAIEKGDGVPAMIEHLNRQFGHLEVRASDLEGRNSRSAYFKTMFLIFRQDGAKDWFENLRIALNHSGAKHKLEFHHIFPQGVLKKFDVAQNNIDDIANLSFIGSNTNRKISNKPPSEYLPPIIERQGEQTLTKQCIPTDPELLAVDRYDDFLKRRRELIAERINKFLRHDQH